MRPDYVEVVLIMALLPHRSWGFCRIVELQLCAQAGALRTPDGSGRRARWRL